VARDGDVGPGSVGLGQAACGPGPAGPTGIGPPAVQGRGLINAVCFYDDCAVLSSKLVNGNLIYPNCYPRENFFYPIDGSGQFLEKVPHGFLQLTIRFIL